MRSCEPSRILHHFGANNSFRIRTYKLRFGKPFRFRTYEKQGGRGVPGKKNFNASLPPVSATPPSSPTWIRNIQRTAAAPPPDKALNCAPSEIQSVDTTTRPRQGKDRLPCQCSPHSAPDCRHPGNSDHPPHRPPRRYPPQRFLSLTRSPAAGCPS